MQLRHAGFLSNISGAASAGVDHGTCNLPIGLAIQLEVLARSGRRDIAQDLPLRAGLADLSRNLGAERDAALGRRLRTAPLDRLGNSGSLPGPIPLFQNRVGEQ